MDEKEMLKAIVDSYPAPIVFVDNDYIIRFLNRLAKERFHQDMEHPALLGKSIFDCHNPHSIEKIKFGYTQVQKDGKPFPVGVNHHNENTYIQGVTNHLGEYIGFFELCIPKNK